MERFFEIIRCAIFLQPWSNEMTCCIKGTFVIVRRDADSIEIFAYPVKKYKRKSFRLDIFNMAIVSCCT